MILYVITDGCDILLGVVNSKEKLKDFNILPEDVCIEDGKSICVKSTRGELLNVECCMLNEVLDA